MGKRKKRRMKRMKVEVFLRKGKDKKRNKKKVKVREFEPVEFVKEM